ncbi:MAG: RCC1 domain-containing protein, partial [Polyangiaceae bacterium]
MRRTVAVILAAFCVFGCRRGKKPPAAKDVREVVAGDGHACALFKDGALRCWGSNSRGQAGRAAGEPVLQPISIASSAPISDVYAGSTLTLVHLADKTWRGWGGLADADNKPVTLDIVTAPWKKAAIGHSHVCGVSDSGTVTCAGDNAFGQLGTGVRDGSAKPVRV